METICEPITDSNITLFERLNKLYQILVSSKDRFPSGCYDSAKKVFASTTYDMIEISDVRVWYFQLCNELGWFQPSMTPMFQNILDLESV